MLASLALLAGVFTLGLLAPPELAISVALAPALLPSVAARFRREPLLLAGVASLLALVIALANAGHAAPRTVTAHLVLALAAIWGTAGLLARHVSLRRMHEAASREGQDVGKELADFKHALDKSSIVAITDQRGVITYVNDKFCEISKYSREELLGQDHRIINSGHHPKDFIRELWRTIAQGQVWRGELRNRAKDGAIYWVDTTIVPFLDDRGKPFQYVAIRDDITERKQAEAKLREQAALTRLGEMAAVVAHEVKNPLAGIAGALEIIGSRLPPGSPDLAIVAEMLTRLGALNDMVEDMLVFARPKPLRLAPVSLGTVVRETVSHLRPDPNLQQVTIDVEGDDPLVRADGQALEQVFQNLVLNAAQAMGGRGRVQVNVAHAEGKASVSVADRGPGIAPDMRERVFEPFFTTKHRGTGLGLAVARRVVEAHGGAITVVETPGGGATLRVSLPAESRGA